MQATWTFFCLLLPTSFLGCSLTWGSMCSTSRGMLRYSSLGCSRSRKWVLVSSIWTQVCVILCSAAALLVVCAFICTGSSRLLSARSTAEIIAKGNVVHFFLFLINPYSVSLQEDIVMCKCGISYFLFFPFPLPVLIKHSLLSILLK